MESDVLICELRWAIGQEQQMHQFYTELAQKVTSPELKHQLEQHAEDAFTHVSMLIDTYKQLVENMLESAV